MGKEFFTLGASKELVELFDQAARKTGHGRGRVFSDFLTVSRCALAGGTMEDEYHETIKKGYTDGDPGKRAIDTLKTAFHLLIGAMEDTGQDVLGDVFQGAITYGENGQFFTPDSVCAVMAGLTVPSERTEERRSVNDPACGSGRQLLAVAKTQPHWEFTGQDVDHRCVQMTAINMGLNGLRGWAVWQNTLTLECNRVYKIGFGLHGGMIREVPIEKSPFDYRTIQKPEAKNARPGEPERPVEPPQDRQKPSQLDLF
ncbi:N-6 DNA methylase [Rhodopirellula bahusiensis]|uniref:site-specific DNA-methyltransferase (adenine-specific) n=1 Tax=Rhodopirellula bahusiensis TaxID=2014065 RepID=A0A2G1VYK0_9BACT|nr:N-6 DNA methylase [Rhodopirellula bahusiensis]PHQ31499.1 N-6 DNA methylase [Rhodopirellula bahusiensis]